MTKAKNFEIDTNKLDNVNGGKEIWWRSLHVAQTSSKQLESEPERTAFELALESKRPQLGLELESERPPKQLELESRSILERKQFTRP